MVPKHLLRIVEDNDTARIVPENQKPPDEARFSMAIMLHEWTLLRRNCHKAMKQASGLGYR